MARQKKKGNAVITAIILAVCGIVVLIMGIKDLIGTSGDLLNVSTCDESEVQPGEYVEATITSSYGAYVETTTTYNHIITRTDGYYYLVDVCDKNADGTDKDTAKWMGVQIKKSQKTDYDNIDYEDASTAISIKGYVRKNTSEIQGYLEDFIKDYVDLAYLYYGGTTTLTDSDYQLFYDQALPYYIKVIRPSDYWTQIGLGALLLIIGAVIIISAINKRKTAAQTSAVYSGAGGMSGTYGMDGTSGMSGTYGTGSMGGMSGTYGMDNTGGMSDTYGTYSAEGYNTAAQNPYGSTSAEQTAATRNPYGSTFAEQTAATQNPYGNISDEQTTATEEPGKSSFSSGFRLKDD